MGSFATNYEEIVAVLLFVIGMSNLVFQPNLSFPKSSSHNKIRPHSYGYYYYKRCRKGCQAYSCKFCWFFYKVVGLFYGK